MAIIILAKRCTPTAEWPLVPEKLAHPWPDNPVVYEIYPRSFQDSNGDGVGDLKGVLQRVDYIADLGVDAVWLGPFTQSPWKDGGYDPSSYVDIDAAMGTLDIFVQLVDALHARGLRVVIDLVLNHTSDQHPWFEKSFNKEQGYEDYYVWHDAKPAGGLPNNWMTRFGPPAWTWHHKREQYYLHNYLACQPALNLRCQRVQDELRSVVQTWKGRGVDGFRLDAVTSYLCDTQFRDNPPATQKTSTHMDGDDFLPYSRQDHRFDILPGDGTNYAETVRQWCGDELWLLGEVGTGNQSIKISDQLTQPGKLDAAYPVDIPQFGFTAKTLCHILSNSKHPSSLGWWTQSHDRARIGNGPEDPENLFQLFFLTHMPGTILLYQGQELGLPQPLLQQEDVTDPYDLKYWPDGPGREGARVPLPWNNKDENYSFTSGTPWLPMDWQASCSVEAQERSGPQTQTRKWLSSRKVLGLHCARIDGWSCTNDVVSITFLAKEKHLRLILNFTQNVVEVPDKRCLSSSSPNYCSGRLPGRSGVLHVAD